MLKVIAVSGWKGSGKDTVADNLVKNHGYTRLGFADVLKDMVAQQYDIPRSSCDDDKAKEMGLSNHRVDPQDGFSKQIGAMLFKEFRMAGSNINPYKDWDDYLDRDQEIECPLHWTPRALCILEGSIKRSVDSFYWVRAVMNKMTFDPTPNQKYVISDLRYKSEIAQLEAFIPKGLEVVRVNRFDDVNSDDPSERDLDDYPFETIIDNTGTLADLEKQCAALADSSCGDCAGCSCGG